MQQRPIWKKQQALIHLHWQQKQIWLAWKLKVDNLDVDKLKTVPADLSKLSNIVDNDVV